MPDYFKPYREYEVDERQSQKKYCYQVTKTYSDDRCKPKYCITLYLDYVIQEEWSYSSITFLGRLFTLWKVHELKKQYQALDITLKNSRV